jgi:hypothetical protein
MACIDWDGRLSRAIVAVAVLQVLAIEICTLGRLSQFPCGYRAED